MCAAIFGVNIPYIFEELLASSHDTETEMVGDEVEGAREGEIGGEGEITPFSPHKQNCCARNEIQLYSHLLGRVIFIGSA